MDKKENRGLEMDGQHTSKTQLTVLTSTISTSTVRIEDYGSTNITYIQENSKTDAHKWDLFTLVAMRDALNRWYSGKFGDAK